MFDVCWSFLGTFQSTAMVILRHHPTLGTHGGESSRPNNLRTSKKDWTLGWLCYWKPWGNHGETDWFFSILSCTCFLNNIHKNQSNDSIPWKQHWKDHGLIQANITNRWRLGWELCSSKTSMILLIQFLAKCKKRGVNLALEHFPRVIKHDKHGTSPLYVHLNRKILKQNGLFSSKTSKPCLITRGWPRFPKNWKLWAKELVKQGAACMTL